MANVYPMRPLGAGEDDAELLTYTHRDTIGVEAPGALPSDWTGWNEGAEWTERLAGAWGQEHHPAGVHNTLKIARGLIRCLCDKTTAIPTYFAAADSYLQDTNGAIAFGTLAFTCTRGASAGLVTIDLLGGFTLPSLNARIDCYPSRGQISRVNRNLNTAGGCIHQTTRLDSVPLVTRIVVRNYANDTPTDDNFTIGIHDL